MTKFLRRNTDRHSKLGRKRKKKQVWRKPKGRHNKMREKIRGRPAVVKVGYRKSNENRKKIEGRNPVLIMNVKDVDKIGKDEIGIVGSVGKRNKIEIAKKAKERKIPLHNINIEKFLEQNQIKQNDKEKERRTNAKMSSANVAVLENKK